MLIIIIINYVILLFLILSSFMQLLSFPSYFQFHAAHHIHISLIISYISCSSSFILMYSYHVYLHHSCISYHVHIPCQSYHVHLIYYINTIIFAIILMHHVAFMFHWHSWYHILFIYLSLSIIHHICTSYHVKFNQFLNQVQHIMITHSINPADISYHVSHFTSMTNYIYST